MSTPIICLLIVAIGFVAGLRSMTAPAVVSWGAHLGWLALKGSPLGFLSSPVAAGIFTLAALGELVADQLPTTPNRTAPVGFGARIVTGGFCGAAIALAAEQPWLVGVGLGVVGAVMGTRRLLCAHRHHQNGQRSPIHHRHARRPDRDWRGAADCVPFLRSILRISRHFRKQGAFPWLHSNTTTPSSSAFRPGGPIHWQRRSRTPGTTLF